MGEEGQGRQASNRCSNERVFDEQVYDRTGVRVGTAANFLTQVAYAGRPHAIAQWRFP